MNRKYIALKWLIPGALFLSLLAVPAHGYGLSVFHLTAVRTELVEVQHISNVHAITFSKAVHISSHAHNAYHSKAPVYSHLAVRLYSNKAETEAKNTESREPFWMKLHFKLKIPSSGDSNVDMH
ncbi:MAG: hypothetical protein JXR41_02575 [Bacteroidales bacterium]|nr:hypothetical protein [Bacteroidales bacterium]MBN2761949.1 hypothetical protein [Bacteroidales bacterium]